MYKRFGRKSDANQSDIMWALRAVGAVVFEIQEPFDLLVDYKGEWYVIEVKNPDTNARKKGGSKLTDVQAQILARTSAPVYVVETGKQAVDVLSGKGVPYSED